MDRGIFWTQRRGSHGIDFGYGPPSSQSKLFRCIVERRTRALCTGLHAFKRVLALMRGGSLLHLRSIFQDVCTRVLYIYTISNIPVVLRCTVVSDISWLIYTGHKLVNKEKNPSERKQGESMNKCGHCEIANRN